MINAVNAMEIKRRVRELGADLCGIAPAARFEDAPQGFQPTDVLKECKSIIVVALRFPLSTLSSSSPAAYTFVRNQLCGKIDTLTFQISSELEQLGCCAVPVPSSEPYEFWDESRRHGQGIVSLKHAAVRAGLGKMGKNTLLINDQLGNMLWLGAVLADADLEPDQVADYQACLPNCNICLEACPAKALDGITIEQRQCRAVSAKYSEGGGGVYTCNLCRKICPQYRGIKVEAG
ncbi:epoxyqueuosine reductase [Sporomusa acidovorans]|uniref:Epoxyqueuosine reductase n=1 Tax=Sporomusa acidovorans (strain ATCC 49682 / DSM 3132 / Mol) TaxID=1123286 RepID=A0ABZ3JBA2_SPOA4|nr:epoxyqueuosine reductase [Sporomusa acidovorans]OZC13347.1 epoxyqueuosine reductase [Sporomusa acidovorans DSM 3132]SDD95520.1 Epoxyqueuosine reductase QueG (queuosine biosynthesis) [Sporomusa acidovorans]